MCFLDSASFKIGQAVSKKNCFLFEEHASAETREEEARYTYEQGRQTVLYWCRSILCPTHSLVDICAFKIKSRMRKKLLEGSNTMCVTKD